MDLNLRPPTPYWCDPAARPSDSAWRQWKISFTNYLDLLPAASAYSESQKLKLLRHLLGDEGQRHFDALDLQSSNCLSKALDVLDKSWGHQSNVFASRFKFCQLKQNNTETLEDFLYRLRSQVRFCEYDNVPKNKIEGVLLVQQLISGVADHRIRECLLTEDPAKLTWDRAVEIARAKTLVVEQSKIFNTRANPFDISKIQKTLDYTQTLQKCFRCGSLQHKANCATCPARNVDCKTCGKRGHYARCCRSNKILNVTPSELDISSPLPPDKNVYSVTPVHSRLCSPVSHEPKLPSSDIRTVTFVVHGRKSFIDMELDSACPITIVPSSFYDDHLFELSLNPTAYKFDSYTNSPVEIRGYVIVTIEIAHSSSSVAVYVSAGDTRPLLGRNAMVALNISPSVSRMRIMSISAHTLQSKYPVLFGSSIGCIPTAVHRIRLKPNAVPVAIGQPRPIPLARKQTVSSALQQMVVDDLIEPIYCSEWVHLMVTVLKKDGSVRICNDLQALNSQIIVDKFVLPSPDELFVHLAGARFFSKLDLRKAFFHMPLTPDSRPLTAFLTMEGLFQYKVLPMGLSSAPAAWQKFMVHSLADLPGQIAYMDDICVFGHTVDEHDTRLHAVLQRLNNLNLRLNIEKCQFRVNSIEFLGHTITSDGIKPNTENTRAITDAPRPNNATELKHFLGLCSYYLRYLKDFATLAEPLRQLTKEKSEFVWSSSQQKAFEEIKRRIVSAPVMAIFDEKCPTIVTTDASNIGLGAILSQIQNGQEKVIAYASRKLTKTEAGYSAGEKEALACVWACEKWNLFLYGRPFTLRTDHSALRTLLTRGNTGLKPLRIHRWYARLLNYDFQIVFRPGRENQAADGLSRLPLDEIEQHEDMAEQLLVSALGFEEISAVKREDLQKATAEDDTLSRVKQYLLNGWPNKSNMSASVRHFYTLRHELSVVDGCLMRGTRFVAPLAIIPKIMSCAHEGHPGIVRTKRKAETWFWWPGMSKYLENFVRDCEPCQLADKSSKPIASPVQPIDYPMRPWSKIAIDIMGPFSLAPSHQKNCLVATCFYSKWPEVHLCGDITTASIIRWLRHVFSRFGLPEEIVTDNGPQFTSQDFKLFLENCAIKHSRTTPYNPAANGMVERFNRTLKETIQAIRLSGKSWENAVLDALFTYRTTHHRATNKTPAELMFGRPIRTKLNAAHTLPDTGGPDEIKRRKRYQTTYMKSAAPMRSGTFVRLTRHSAAKGESKLTEPLKVERACGPGTYMLANGQKVNARRMYTSIRRRECDPSPSYSRNAPELPMRRTTRRNKPPDRYGYNTQFR